MMETAMSSVSVPTAIAGEIAIVTASQKDQIMTSDNMKTIHAKGIECFNQMHEEIEEKSRLLRETENALTETLKENVNLKAELENKSSALATETEKRETFQRQFEELTTVHKALKENPVTFQLASKLVICRQTVQQFNEKLSSAQEELENLTKIKEELEALQAKNLEHFVNLEQSQKEITEKEAQQQKTKEEFEKAMDLIRYIMRECQAKTNVMGASSSSGFCLTSSLSNGHSLDAELGQCKDSFKRLCEMQKDNSIDQNPFRKNYLSAFRQTIDKPREETLYVPTYFGRSRNPGIAKKRSHSEPGLTTETPQTQQQGTSDGQGQKPDVFSAKNIFGSFHANDNHTPNRPGSLKRGGNQGGKEMTPVVEEPPAKMKCEESVSQEPESPVSQPNIAGTNLERNSSELAKVPNATQMALVPSNNMNFSLLDTRNKWIPSARMKPAPRPTPTIVKHFKDFVADGRYNCKCGEGFDSDKLLSTHVAQNNRTYQCGTCFKVFENPYPFSKHLAVHARNFRMAQEAYARNPKVALKPSTLTAFSGLPLSAPAIDAVSCVKPSSSAAFSFSLAHSAFGTSALGQKTLITEFGVLPYSTLLSDSQSSTPTSLGTVETIPSTIPEFQPSPERNFLPIISSSYIPTYIPPQCSHPKHAPVDSKKSSTEVSSCTCRLNFNSAVTLGMHIQFISQGCKFRCDAVNCDELFDSISSANEHAETHNPETKVVDDRTGCKHCGVIFVSSLEWEQHLVKDRTVDGRTNQCPAELQITTQFSNPTSTQLQTTLVFQK